jgi:iron complex outermembrane receptor protein
MIRSKFHCTRRLQRGLRICHHTLPFHEATRLRAMISCIGFSIVLIITGSFFPILLNAQNDQQPSVSAMETIVVEATRMSRPLAQVPTAITVVNQNDIQFGRQQLALDEVLNRVPGVFMQNRYNYAQDLRISIRGFGARAAFGIRGIKILVDGIPETLPDGTGQVDSIDLGATRSIEVIRGPSSSLYGNASGGVINIISEEGPEIPYISTRISAGDYNFQKVQLKAGGQTDLLNYFVSFSDMEIGGYREHSQAENSQFTGRFNFNLDKDRTFRVVFNATDQPISNDPGGVNAADAAANPRAARGRNVTYDTGEALSQERIGFVFSTPIGESGELTARNYFVWRDFSNKLPQFPKADAVNLNRFFTGGGITYTHSNTLVGMPNRLIIGFDIDDQNDERMRFLNNKGILGELQFNQNENFSAHGVFIQNELSVNEKLQLSFGLRYDQVNYSVTDNFLSDGNDSGNRKLNDASPMLGATYNLSPTVNLFGSIATSFETPSTSDFANPNGGGGFNPSLDPQSATNHEIGLRGTISEHQYFEVALFNIDINKEIVPFDDDGRTYYQNAGTSSRSGIELSWISNPTDRVRTSLSYSYGDFEFENFQTISIDGNGVQKIDKDYSGNNTPGTVDHLLFGEVTYTHPYGWFGAFDFMHVGEQFANNANTVKVDAHTIANFRLGLEREIGSTTVSPFLGINNIFDKNYYSNIRLNAFGSRYFETAPARNIYAGFTVDFGFR